MSLSSTSVLQAGTEPTSDDGREDVETTPSAAPPGVATEAVPSNGTLYFSIDVDDEDQPDDGLYSLDVNTAAATFLGETGVTSNTVGLTEGPDPATLIGSTYTDLTSIAADGSGFETVDDDLIDAEGLAYDPVNDVLYKIINNRFATADLATGATITPLATATDDPEGLAWRGTDGLIYALAADTSLLYRYDPGSDTWDTVGDTGIADSDENGLAWDPVADVLYAITNEGILYRIDPDTAATVEVGDTGLGAGGGLAFIAAPPPAPEPAPIVLEPTFTG